MPHTKHRPRWRFSSLFVWHRYFGLLAGVFLIVLSLTGLALNHSQDLALAKQRVQTPWLLDWYGIQAPEQLSSITLDTHTITLIGERLYLNQRPLAGEFEQLIGAADLPGKLVLALDNRIILLNTQGELIGMLSGADGVPSGMQALGVDPQGQLVIKAAHGFYHPDADFLLWTHWRADPQRIRWSQQGQPSPALSEALKRDYRERILSWERVTLDLHSGRIVGVWGVYLVDAAGIFLLLLALSGLLLWLQRLRKRRQHRHKAPPH